MTTSSYLVPYYVTYCAWCILRDGDFSTHPDSPVYDQDCGPACIGATRCHVRELKR